MIRLAVRRFICGSAGFLGEGALAGALALMREDRAPLHVSIVRTWACRWGITHDHDVNAAQKLLATGLAEAAWEDGARPQRSTRGGQSSMKREPQRAIAGIPRPQTMEDTV